MKIVKVTAAVIEKNGQILLAKRKSAQHMGGKWEFPGGKIEIGEIAELCLRRELKEELGIETEIGRHICTSLYTYEEKCIELIAFSVTHTGGDFHLHEHDEIAWVPAHKLLEYDLAPADIPIAKTIIEGNF